MADNETIEATETEAAAPKAKKRRKVATHEFRTADGKKVTNPANAASYAYQAVDADDEIIWEREMSLANYPQEIRDALAYFGLKTKSTNTTSQARQQNADEAEFLDDMDASFRSGEWKGDSGESMAGVKLLAEALLRAKGNDWQDEAKVAQMVEWLGGLTEEQRDGYEKNPAVKSAIKLIRAERVIAKTSEPADAEGLDDIPV